MFSSLVYWMLTVGVKCDAGCDNLICCCRLWPHGGSVEQCHWVIQCILVFSSCLDNLEIWPVSVNTNISCEILWYKHFKDVICPYFDPQRPGTSLWGAWLSCIYSVFPLLIQSVSIKCQTSFNSGEAEVSVWLISSLMFTFVFSFFRWIHQNFETIAIWSPAGQMKHISTGEQYLTQHQSSTWCLPWFLKPLSPG